MESFGARLKLERERQGMTLDTVAAATKIGTRLLQALEEEKFDRLPGGIFNKGFVRAYARHLGLDEEKAIADYQVAAGAPPPKEPEAVVAAIAARKVESRAERPTSQSGGFPWGRITIILMVVAVGIALWSSRSAKQKHHEEKTSPVSAPKPASSIPSRAPDQAAAIASAPLAAVAADSFVVLVQARQDSWVSISVDGKDAGSELIRAQSGKSITAHQKIVIKAGNAGGLDFSFNGNKVPAQGAENQVRTLSFDTHGMRPMSENITAVAAPVPTP